LPGHDALAALLAARGEQVATLVELAADLAETVALVEQSDRRGHHLGLVGVFLEDRADRLTAIGFDPPSPVMAMPDRCLAHLERLAFGALEQAAPEGIANAADVDARQHALELKVFEVGLFPELVDLAVRDQQRSKLDQLAGDDAAVDAELVTSQTFNVVIGDAVGFATLESFELLEQDFAFGQVAA